MVGSNINVLGQKMKEEFALRAEPTDGQTDEKMDGQDQFQYIRFFSKGADILIFMHMHISRD